MSLRNPTEDEKAAAKVASQDITAMGDALRAEGLNGRANVNNVPAGVAPSVYNDLQNKVNQQQNNVAMPATVPANAVVMKDTSQLRGSARNEAMGFPGDIEAIHGNVFTMGPRAGNDAEIEQSKRNQAVMDAFYRAQVPESPVYDYRWNHIPGDVIGKGRNARYTGGFDTLERVMLSPGQTQAQAAQAALSHIGSALHGTGTLEGVANTQANINKIDAETANIPEHERNLAKYYDAMSEKGSKEDPFFNWLKTQPQDVQDDFYRGLGKIKKEEAIKKGGGSSGPMDIAKPEEPPSYSESKVREELAANRAKQKKLQDMASGQYNHFQYESPTDFGIRAIKGIGSGIASIFRNPENDMWQ